ncbi:MAG: hypothetical protein CME93_03745 [Hyphomonadaceae bacterium]|nr:hypothetical protein [Hyphomonadaceae bacterium]
MNSLPHPIFTWWLIISNTAHRPRTFAGFKTGLTAITGVNIDPEQTLPPPEPAAAMPGSIARAPPAR